MGNRPSAEIVVGTKAVLRQELIDQLNLERFTVSDEQVCVGRSITRTDWDNADSPVNLGALAAEAHVIGMKLQRALPNYLIETFLVCDYG